MNAILVSAVISEKGRLLVNEDHAISGASPGSDKSTADDEANGG